MADPRFVNYVKANMDKYPMEALKKALAKSGATPEQIDEAVREATAPPPVVPPPPVSTPPPPSQAAAASPPSQAAATPAPASTPAPAGAPAQAAGAAPLDPQGIIAAAKQVLLKPYDFFRSMPKTGGFKEPAIFLIAMTVAAQAITLVLGLGMGVLRLKSMSIVTLALKVIGPAFFGLFIMPIAILVASAIAYVIWMLMGSKERFETSFRCVAYMSAIGVVHAVAGGIPYVGMWLAIPVSLYGIYLFLLASTEVHAVKRKTATIVAGVFGAIVLISGITSAIAVWKIRKLSRMVRSDPRMQALSQFQQAVQTAQQGAKQGRMQVKRAPGDPGGGAPPDMQQAMNAFGAIMGAQQNAETVDHKLLKGVIPESLPGMKRVSLESGKHKLGPMATAGAKAVFQNAQGGRVDVVVADAGSMAGMMTMAWGIVDMENESDTAYERTIDYKGAKAHEKWDSVMRQGLFETVVAKKFLVKVEGQNVTMEEVHQVAKQIDLSRLESLAE